MTETNTRSFSLEDYCLEIANTDVLKTSEMEPILHGLFGEVGGIMSTSKKLVREGSAYPGFKKAAEEEFGDTLWYLAALCRRLNLPLPQLIIEASNHSQTQRSSFADAHGSRAPTIPSISHKPLDSTLFRLGRSVASLLNASPSRDNIVAFISVYLEALEATELSLSTVAERNLQKAQGAFLEPKESALLDFDSQFEPEEQLPRHFAIVVTQRRSGKTYLQWNGVFIGDPLTDNIGDRDGYRFHDVFHFSYAAVLHWSPVIRALIKQKRKSDADCDEVQDGGRAIVIEEGLTAWLFSRAKELNFFEGQARVPLEILKTISEFVQGYEVSRCPLKLWEKAILQGYDAFRQLREEKGGRLIGDRSTRTLHFKSLREER